MLGEQRGIVTGCSIQAMLGSYPAAAVDDTWARLGGPECLGRQRAGGTRSTSSTAMGVGTEGQSRQDASKGRRLGTSQGLVRASAVGDRIGRPCARSERRVRETVVGVRAQPHPL